MSDPRHERREFLLLLAKGYSPEQIDAMNATERAVEAQEALEQGITPERWASRTVFPQQ